MNRMNGYEIAPFCTGQDDGKQYADVYSLKSTGIPEVQLLGEVELLCLC